MTFDKAYTECKGAFELIINCVSARLDFPGVLGMLCADGVAVQVRDCVRAPPCARPHMHATPCCLA